jgi:hypothetical protein
MGRRCPGVGTSRPENRNFSSPSPHSSKNLEVTLGGHSEVWSPSLRRRGWAAWFGEGRGEGVGARAAFTFTFWMWL